MSEMMVLVFTFLLLVSILVSFVAGAVVGWVISDNDKLKTENTRWNLINQTVYSSPD